MRKASDVEDIRAELRKHGGDNIRIIAKIENRIGELFTENLKGQFREVITLDDVDQVIATMGTPDDIIDEDEQPRKSAPKQAKKLYRNPDNKVLGGVAGD